MFVGHFPASGTAVSTSTLVHPYRTLALYGAKMITHYECSALELMPPAEKKDTHPWKQLFYKFLLLCILLLGHFSYLTF